MKTDGEEKSGTMIIEGDTVTLADLVACLSEKLGKTLDDVADVALDNDEEPTQAIIYYTDGSTINIDMIVDVASSQPAAKGIH